MAELATLRTLALQGLTFRPADVTGTVGRPAPALVPNTQVAAGLMGQAATVDAAAKIAQELPAKALEGVRAGRSLGREEYVTDLWSDTQAKAKAGDPKAQAALSDFQISPQGIAYKPVAPALRDLELQTDIQKLADLKARNGLTKAQTEYYTKRAVAAGKPLVNPAYSEQVALWNAANPDDPISEDEEVPGAPALPSPSGDMSGLLPALPDDPHASSANNAITRNGVVAAGAINEGPLSALDPLPTPSLESLAPNGPVAPAPPLAELPPVPQVTGGPAPLPEPPEAPGAPAVAPSEAAKPKGAGKRVTGPNGEIIERLPNGTFRVEFANGSSKMIPRYSKNGQPVAIPYAPATRVASGQSAETNQLLQRGFSLGEIEKMTDEEKGTAMKKAKMSTDKMPQFLQKAAIDHGIVTYGKTQPEIEAALQAKRDETGALPPAQQKALGELHVEMSKDETRKDVLKVRNGYVGVTNGASMDTAAGDLELINGFQQMIDPGATVREGDVALIQSSQGIIQRLQSLPDVWTGKARLGPEMKKAMVETAEKLYRKRVQNYDETSGKKFRELAKAKGVPVKFAEVEFGFTPAPAAAAPATPAGTPPAVAPAPAAGMINIQTSDGATHTIPAAALEQAKQRDPGLKVL